jgi:hypothetical protein
MDATRRSISSGEAADCAIPEAVKRRARAAMARSLLRVRAIMGSILIAETRFFLIGADG